MCHFHLLAFTVMPMHKHLALYSLFSILNRWRSILIVFQSWPGLVELNEMRRVVGLFSCYDGSMIMVSGRDTVARSRIATTPHIKFQHNTKTHNTTHRVHNTIHKNPQHHHPQHNTKSTTQHKNLQHNTRSPEHNTQKPTTPPSPTQHQIHNTTQKPITQHTKSTTQHKNPQHYGSEGELTSR